jgi:hypothetical protein
MSVLGILNILLLYPKKEDEESKWIKKYSKFYFIFLLPLIGLLMVAIWKRLSDYGLTEGRFYVLLLGVWLIGTCVYYLFSKKKEIRLIPLSLLIAASLSSFGPWGASSLSLLMQFSRLEKRLDELKILVNGDQLTRPEGLAQVDFKRAEDLLRYVYKLHGIKPFLDWKTKEGKALTASSTYPDLVKFMQVEDLIVHTYDYYNRDMNLAKEQFYYNFMSDGNELKVAGYDYWSHLNLYSTETNYSVVDEFDIEALLTKDGYLKILRGDKVIAQFSAIQFLHEIRMKHNIKKKNNYTIPSTNNTFTLKGIQYQFHFKVKGMSGNIYKGSPEKEEFRLSRFDSIILVKKLRSN